EGNSLYLRPFMIATQRGLGVNHPSAEYLFCVIASPAAAYFGASATVKVWLDAAEHEWVEEMGGMNLYFVYGSGSGARIVTPTLTGSLLPGITRDSLLRLAPTLSVPATEGRISVSSWRDDCARGELTEVFACGTAAVITPVGAVEGESGGWMI